MNASNDARTQKYKRNQLKRGRYDEIHLATLPRRTRRSVEKLVDAAATADHIDEHGNWDFGAEFDRKKRGVALNWDLYGVGRDIHSRRVLIVIQIRRYARSSANQQWPDIKKAYFLLGRNEDDSVFAHAVSAGVVRSAVRRKVHVIKAVQDWMWGADYRRVVRHGDIGLVPVRRASGSAVVAPVVIDGSHDLAADELLQQGDRLYARNPCLVHLPGVHPDVQVAGWARVATARRGRTYSFAAPTVD